MELDVLHQLAGQDISIDFDEAVLVLDFGDSAFSFLTDLDKRDRFFQIMDFIDESPEIKIVLSLADSDSLNEEAYYGYLRNIYGKDVGLNNINQSWVYEENVERARQLCFHHYTIMRRLASKKVIVDGLRGTIVTPFFGETLSADLRYATPDMRFSLAHKKYGLPPGGALPYFLPRYIGQGKAKEIMLTSDYINAEQAMELGLINGIVSPEDFVAECMKLLRSIGNLSMTTITSARLFSRPLKNDLESYFEAEEKILSGSW